MVPPEGDAAGGFSDGVKRRHRSPEELHEDERQADPHHDVVGGDPEGGAALPFGLGQGTRLGAANPRAPLPNMTARSRWPHSAHVTAAARSIARTATLCQLIDPHGLASSAKSSSVPAAVL